LKHTNAGALAGILLHLSKDNVSCEEGCSKGSLIFFTERALQLRTRKVFFERHGNTAVARREAVPAKHLDKNLLAASHVTWQPLQDATDSSMCEAQPVPLLKSDTLDKAVTWAQDFNYK